MTFRPDKRMLGFPLPYIPVGVFRRFSRLLFAIGPTPPVSFHTLASSNFP